MAAGLAAPRLALADDVQRIPLSKAFRYLDAYLTLPPALHSRFYLVYRAMRNERLAPDLRPVIVAPNGARTPIALDSEADVVRLPSLAELKSNAVLEIPMAGKFRFAIEMRPDLPVSTHVDAPALVAALSQANAAISRLAGAFSAMAPKLDIILFPDSGGGQAVMANGRAAPLPTTSGFKSMGTVLYFEPSAEAGAKTLTLAKAPSRIILARLPKS